jgi:hypothetical protein
MLAGQRARGRLIGCATIRCGRILAQGVGDEMGIASYKETDNYMRAYLTQSWLTCAAGELSGLLLTPSVSVRCLLLVLLLTQSLS